MRLAAVQFCSIAGDVSCNLQWHKNWIESAAIRRADLVLFPELSLTGYEPKLAGTLAIDLEDSRLDQFQDLSDTQNMIICIGAPTRCELGVQISMICFIPHSPRSIYSKRFLHDDEIPYFIEGKQQVVLKLHGKTMVPAICYESLLMSHAKESSKLRAEIYLACVAKPLRGVEKAYAHYPNIANRHNMIVLMANGVGNSDDFESIGKSAVWNSQGKLRGRLDENNEGLLIYDVDTGEIDAYQKKSIIRLAQRLEARKLPKPEWTHEAHLAAAFVWCYQLSLNELLPHARKTIIAHNECVGIANTDDEGYHETITNFWLQIVLNFCQNRSEHIQLLFTEFLVTPQASSHYIFEFFSNELLFSPIARRELVEPDIKPIDL